MPDDTGLQIPDLPKLPMNGKEFFDVLMGQIEPDLVSDNVASLKEKYADETSEEHVARMERYRAAVVAYREKRDHYFASMETQVRQFEKALKESAEGRVTTIEQARLQELENIFNE
ncbi:hypothetical protein CL635_00610 [bacterium]|nr:hypothetical protein [bacterium]|tara:strand:+ start:3590 stop:3937 length:348 start_codon:yes stop_codon:yes gene_type:complete